MTNIHSKDLQRLYIAYFGRPGDPSGINYWHSRIKESLTLKEISYELSRQDEYMHNFANDKSLEYIGLKNRVTAVKNLAILAEKCSIDGIVCSPSDISNIKDSVSNLIYVTPGIRLNDDNEDHVRINTPKKAISLGSDYLVIGRPITEAKEPMDVVKKIISTI